MKLWDKGMKMDALVHDFTVGDDPLYDMQLASYDVIASLAHARMLHERGLLPLDDWQALDNGLREIYERIINGTFSMEEGMEDIHSQVEFELTRMCGDAGKRLHTARSRNDQVLVDIKLLYRDRLRDIVEQVTQFSKTLLGRAEENLNLLLPGYTHGQAAMPSSFGQWFSAHAEALAEALLPLQTAYRVADRNPLGSAAGFGTSFPIDRERTTELLGFSGMHVSAVQAQMGRVSTDLAVANALAVVATALGRFAADVCMYASDNYRFIRLHPEITTGSSIMPHKHNPDVFELIRAHCNLLQSLPGNVSGLATNLTSGYHRDFQLCKSLMLPALTRLQRCLAIAQHATAHIEAQSDILEDRRYDVIFSVDEIQRRVEAGTPFREAYRQVGVELDDGSFTAEAAVPSTHLGSPGNPGITQIGDFLRQERARFDFSRRDKAFSALLGKLPLP
ncbi:argininosuccinate lyase [bacterium]|nr:argininosuccinate lyase [bacterium]